MLSNLLRKSSMMACPAWNLCNDCRLESNQSRTCPMRKSISLSMCAVSPDVHSESSMDCRGLLVPQASRNPARCISTSGGGTISRPERAKKVSVSSLSMMRSVSRFYSEYLIRLNLFQLKATEPSGARDPARPRNIP